MNLLAVSADSKTPKGEKYGVLTGILYLAPVNLSGYQVCPKASVGCTLACLNTAGRGIYDKTQNARIRKTKMFFENREQFMLDLYDDIVKVVRKANRMNLVPAIRLNGTSDIAWEKISFTYNGIHYRNMMEAFPDVTYYDYTKVLGRKSVKNIPNYHLTFSLSESNDSDAITALRDGMNVAVVVNTKRKQVKPNIFSGFPAIDGDDSDLRFMDGQGKIVLLTAKGKARYDTSGFVKSLDYALKE
jgi:hypothetical protein